MRPAPRGAICSNTEASRSMIVGLRNAPRSPTTQVAVRPEATAVTVTLVPLGRVLWAQLPRFHRYHVAWPL